MWVEKRLLKKGAEAEVWLVEFFSKTCVLKKRIKKKYRNNELDGRLISERTISEARMLRRARRLGVLTPHVFFFSKTRGLILEEYISGEKLKDLLLKNKGHEYVAEFGKYLAILHKNGIIHGDPTTSNAIIHKNTLYLIDFGLSFFSKRIEDFATDLLVFERTFLATHFNEQKLVEDFEKAYSATFSKKPVEKKEEIKKRARYL